MPSSRRQGKHTYEFGPFRLDTAEHLLMRDDQRVNITDKAFDLLVVLVQNSRRLMEKSTLMNEVWGDVSVEESNLTQNIKTLRKALGDNADEPCYIETVPGHGYRFKHPVMVKEMRRAFAVLPFQPLIGEAEDAMLGLGLASAVISRLDSLGIEELVVRPRSAIIRYNIPNQDEFAAAREQDADYVLVGHFLSSGNRIRVDVDFLRVHDEKKIWAREFTEEITDNLSVQQALANSIARDVALHFGQGAAIADETRVKGDYTASSEAYQLYVEGRFHWNKFTRAGFKMAVVCFRQAITIDPQYAKAYSGLSDCWLWLGVYSLLPPDRAFPKARKWAEKALKIYPELSGAHTALAFIEMFVERDNVAAAKRFEHAIGLYPDNIKALLGYSLLLTGLKEFNRALTEVNKALEIYSISLINNVTKGMILYEARRYDEALEQFEKAIKLDENFDAIYYGQAQVFAELKEYDQAVATAQIAIDKSQNNLLNHMVLAYVLAMKGDKAAAQEIVKRLEALDMEKWYVSPFHLATVHAALGQKKRAYYWLEQARDKHDAWFTWLHTDPRLDPLRGDPQFGEDFPFT
jgi:DNA-binding winged helix-turn-helix (wHTH) protein/Tfp pilus assembly protein PilF